jgi:hypothetical protein
LCSWELEGRGHQRACTLCFIHMTCLWHHLFFSPGCPSLLGLMAMVASTTEIQWKFHKIIHANEMTTGAALMY